MQKSDELHNYLKTLDSLAIVCHHQPDPDCLASGFALQWIAKQVEIDRCSIFYQGKITHQEILSLVNIFEIPIEEIEEGVFDSFDHIALIDHSVSGTEVELPDEIPVEVIIDIKETEHSIDIPFIDSRPSYGATSTILTEYIQEQEKTPPVSIASALLFAIHNERLDHVRYPTLADYQAATELYPDADIDLIEEVYGSSLTPSTLDAIGQAINHREKQGSTLVSSIGRTTETGALPQAADYLLRLEGVKTVLVMGIADDKLRLSAQSFDPRIDVGTAVEEAFSTYGAAGGHPDRAGGELPLGIFAKTGDHEAAVEKQLFKIVAKQFFNTLNI
ncbi:bifunctional oligoribonuclease/PAP phosphatase NrnA [Haladaptatus sp. DYF46]|uniref:DHH family phosphoesterase n=1 Tax=Haladaptatus sp. DYF46 TaxID=2886041 RepID=UPI001E5066AB|nr:bifunctional oligoribonuclease/PAP phosphatase NrnA [Haladaptatus sp. DYF46]